MSTNPVTAEFELTRDDIMDWTLYYFQKSQTMRRQVRAWQFGVPFVMLIVALTTFLYLSRDELAYMGWRDVALFIAVILSIVLAFTILWMILVPQWVRWQTMRIAEKLYLEGPTDPALGEVRFSLTPHAVISATNVSEERLAWGAIDRIVATDKHIFFVIGGAKAFVVPRRGFPDEGAYREFFETAHDLQEEAKRVGHSQGEE